MKILIAGSGGLGREVLSTILDNNARMQIFFFNDKWSDKLQPQSVYGKFPILKSTEEISSVLGSYTPFICAAGHGKHRKRLREKLQGHLTLTQLVSKRAYVGHFSTFGVGAIVQPNCGISNDVQIGDGLLINTNAQIAHDTLIGDYVSIGSNVVVLGHCHIESFVTIYANATILPHVKIGSHAVIGAGSLVNRDVLPYETFISGRG